jgi:hypothetical protein
MLIGFLSAPVLRAVLTTLLKSRLPLYLPGSILEVGSGLAAAVVREMLRYLAWESLCLVLISIVMLYWAARIERQAARRIASEASTQIVPKDPAGSS